MKFVGQINFVYKKDVIVNVEIKVNGKQIQTADT